MHVLVQCMYIFGFLGFLYFAYICLVDFLNVGLTTPLQLCLTKYCVYFYVYLFPFAVFKLENHSEINTEKNLIRENKTDDF